MTSVVDQSSSWSRNVQWSVYLIPVFKVIKYVLSFTISGKMNSCDTMRVILTKEIWWFQHVSGYKPFVTGLCNTGRVCRFDSRKTSLKLDQQVGDATDKNVCFQHVCSLLHTINCNRTLYCQECCDFDNGKMSLKLDQQDI